MVIYRCEFCGYEFNEEQNGKLISEIEECPICKHPPNNFKEIEGQNEEIDLKIKKHPLEYPSETARVDVSISHMMDIHRMAVNGSSIIDSMSTKIPIINWDDILIIANQLNPLPLSEDININTTTIIGKSARQPMVIENPVYISHMSFGALSYETKIALAKGSCIAKTAMSSGEGGILEEELKSSYKYIFEYVPNKYSLTKENLLNSDAIEIKIGQGTKPGMGGHLPGEKVTKEIAKIRGKAQGEDIISPSIFDEIQSKEDLKFLVSNLRDESEGKPIGIKIAAGKIEKDLEYCCFAEPDFITVDGRGGATGASPKIIRDSTSIPTVFALYRARKYLDDNKIKNIDLVITGGLRVSSDFAKALAMGADAIAIASAPLMAAACQQYRICGTGECPVGVATQNESLRKNLKIEKASQRVANYLNVSLEEIKTFARITGNKNIHDLSTVDLSTFNSEISNYTNIPHV